MLRPNHGSSNVVTEESIPAELDDRSRDASPSGGVASPTTGIAEVLPAERIMVNHVAPPPAGTPPVETPVKTEIIISAVRLLRSREMAAFSKRRERGIHRPLVPLADALALLAPEECRPETDQDRTFAVHSFATIGGVVRFATKSLISLRIVLRDDREEVGSLSKEGTSKPSIRVTDRRLFTEEGDLRDPSAVEAGEEPSPNVESPTPPEPSEPKREEPRLEEPSAGEPQPGRGPGQTEPEHPGTLFTSFLDSLVVNAYMAMGMVRNPYRDEQEVDVEGARQMIDIIEMLGKKTQGNLTPEESDYLKAHLGELKLAFLRRSQSIR